MYKKIIIKNSSVSELYCVVSIPKWNKLEKLIMIQRYREQVCEHCAYRNADDYNWQNKTIILAADYASNGIYNFIIPLRAHFHPKTSLNPIIILLERRPDIAFLDAISYFPLVYWMLGSIDW